ncbi:nucleotidyltransferase domain-containing protein [Microbacterium protaetiae]|uniref:Nucleotidyltransferase domain-containing protein n=1 Tax=Microbacterium protaetiae TaxID=2509458 RepID=A0A4V0YD29_9MICO|nr:nucleotidyltransferase domain-containing protein [Microbacterium protaetiae]QAY59271.1 nucleotidyltransferase domain-containing protein [Microbacterium protaetiae]
MNLSEPLDGLTSMVEAAVLRVLARADAGFSGRQVHTLAGVGSTSSVHRALGHLVRVGIVTAESRPPAIIYRANREHALWPVIESGLGARARVFDGIRHFCEHDLPEDLDLTVVVYGSVARRESTLESDVDLFVVYPDGIDDDARAEFSYMLASHVQRATGNETQVYSVERAEAVQRLSEDDPLVANVVEDGILVFGPPLKSLTRSAA